MAVRLFGSMVALGVVVGTGGCVDGGSPPVDGLRAPAAAAVVGSQDTELLLRGAPWWPSGFNAPQIATNYAINYGCGAEVDLDEFFGKLPRNSLTRFAMFQALAVNKSTGELDFRAADAVFAAAQRHGQLVLPVLIPQNGDCDDEVFKQRDWFVRGWTEYRPIAGRAVMSPRDWVRTAVERWRSSPMVAGWTVIGEPEPSNCAGSTCEERRRTCPGDAAQVLRAFMDESGALVRALDPQRLIFAGFLGGGQCGTVATEFEFVGAALNVDVLEYHDYSDGDVALPGGRRNGLATRIVQARALRKPLLVAEIGIPAGSCLPVAERRDYLAAKLAAQRDAGTAGALFWAFVPDPRPDQCTLDIGPDDPLWAVVAEYSTLG
ncbi:beta-mannosidase [Nocardia sp. NPDC051832]|uniref:beta-mannosidase n=1 Tax=Nocardia sp. NPDC051832 TaxID=3155673 RepID=UPI00343049C7